jgi:hypothetical protein
MNEIHELGLMYLHYEIVLSGYKSLLRWKHADWKLKRIKTFWFNYLRVIFTVQPDRGVINEYVQQMTDELLDDKRNFLPED